MNVDGTYWPLTWTLLFSRFKFIKSLPSCCKCREVLHPIFPSLLRRHAGPSRIKELPPWLIKVFSTGLMTKPLSHHHLHFPPAHFHIIDAQIPSSAAVPCHVNRVLLNRTKTSAWYFYTLKPGFHLYSHDIEVPNWQQTVLAAKLANWHSG